MTVAPKWVLESEGSQARRQAHNLTDCYECTRPV